MSAAPPGASISSYSGRPVRDADITVHTVEEIITTRRMASKGRPAMVTGVAAYWSTEGGDRAVGHWLPPRGGEHCGVAEVDLQTIAIFASDCTDDSI